MHQGRGEQLAVDQTRVRAEADVVDGAVSVIRLLYHVQHSHRYLST